MQYLEDYIYAVTSFGIATRKPVFFEGDVTLDNSQMQITLPDSTPGTPIVPTNGAFRITGEDGQDHIEIFKDMDGDGDYDADWYTLDNSYMGAGGQIHQIPRWASGAPSGRMVFDIQSSVNLLLTGRNFSATTFNDFAIAKYGSPSFHYVRFKTASDGTNGWAGFGLNAGDTISARGHWKDTSSTVNFFESTQTTSRITFRASGSTSNTGVGIGATGDDLTLRAGGANHGTLSSAGRLSIPALLVSTAATPASAGATGVTGQVQWDTDYIYVCVATNTWKRASIATW